MSSDLDPMSTDQADREPTARIEGMGGSMRLSVDDVLEKLQRETFGYFLHETNPPMAW